MTVHIRPDKRFHRARLKPVRRRQGASYLKVIARIIAIAVLAFGCAYWLLETVRNTSLLRIETITVIGNNRLSAGEVDESRHHLRATGWIEDATLRRVLPSTIEVVVNEREPVGLGRFGSALYLIDSEGVILDEFSPRFRDLDLPIIDGLSVGVDGDDRGVDKRRAALVTELLSDIERQAPRLSELLSQVDVADPHDAVVLLSGDPVYIHLGAEQFAERLQTYEELKPLLSARVSDVDYVDLRFDGRIYVRPLDEQ